jgi:hypothetical protein
MAVASSDFKTAVDRNSFHFPQSFVLVHRQKFLILCPICDTMAPSERQYDDKFSKGIVRLLYVNNKATQTDAWLEPRQEHRLSCLRFVFRANPPKLPRFDFVHILSNSSITLRSDADLRH